MNIGEKQKKSNASEDLTVVLLRGNGSPRSFRFSLPALHRSLALAGFLFALAVFTALALAGFSLLRELSLPAQVAEAPAPTANEAGSPGLWQQLKGSVNTAPTAPTDAELAKEVEGLRQQVAELGSRLENRQALEADAASPLIQFFGPRSSLIPETQTFMRIKNPRVTRDANAKQVVLTFELHNVDPGQSQQRGYIMAIAKAPDMILTYPNYALRPGENILLDYTKGETFAISRFREAKATFPLAPLEGRKTSFQILLFTHDGKVIGNMHVDGGNR